MKKLDPLEVAVFILTFIATMAILLWWMNGQWPTPNPQELVQ